MLRRNKKMFKKVMSLLLSLILVVTTLSVSSINVFADSQYLYPDPQNSAESVGVQMTRLTL